MKNYGKVFGSTYPQEVEITADVVLVASNIEQYEEEIDGKTISGYKYDYVKYTKDEYIQLLAEKAAQIDELAEELEAAKILLGVE